MFIRRSNSLSQTASSVVLRMAACALLSLSLTQTHASLGNTGAPTPYGLRFYRTDAPAPAPLPPRQSAPEADAWKARIVEQEYLAGPYGAELSETLQDAGRYFYERGDFDAAIEQWRRAVHLLRVNEGLYSQRQLPLLERLRDTYLARGDIESADEIESYLWFLSRQYYQPGDPDRLEALLRWQNWLRQQWLRNPNPSQPRALLMQWRDLSERIQDAENAAELSANDMSATNGAPMRTDSTFEKNRAASRAPSLQLSARQLEALTQAQLNVLYVTSITDLGLGRDTQMILGANRGRTDPLDEPSVEQTQVRNMQESAYARGRARLRRLLDRFIEARDWQGRARTLLALGDWHLWFDQPRRAQQSYKAVWQVLEARRGESQSIALALQQEWFSAPVELPVNQPFRIESVTYPEYQSQRNVEARFGVTDRGRVVDLQTTSGSDENNDAAEMLYRQMRGMRFRPRMIGGEAVATPDIIRRYRVAF